MQISRRQFAKLFGGAVIAAPGNSLLCRLDGSGSTAEGDAGLHRSAVAVSDAPVDVVVTGDRPSGFTVPAGQRWRVQGLVRSWANVVVNGELVMRSGDELQFVGASPSQYVGGGMVPRASDVGLWVMGAGALDIEGSPRTGWARGGPASNWSASDSVVVCPSNFGDSTGFQERTLGAAPWPAGGIARANGSFLGTEVLNLARDVRISGTGHVFINSSRPQRIRFASLVDLGVRSPTLGRYPLHFHMCGDGSRGSLVEGVVIRGGKQHAFVPHMSHGITFRDCVAYRTTADAYWWDPSDDAHMNDSSDTWFDRCVAASTSDTSNNTRLSGFRLAGGMRNACTGCVAVGTQGGAHSSGYIWPENGINDTSNAYNGTWNFQGNVAHNNRSHGIFTWQNNLQVHDVEEFVGYRNGKSGIFHGAYINRFVYAASELLENGQSGVGLWAVARADFPLTLRDLVIDGRGRTPYGIVLGDHALAAPRETEIIGTTFRGNVLADVRVEAGQNKTPDKVLIKGTRSWSTSGQRFSFADGLPAGTLIKVDDPVLGLFELRERSSSIGAIVTGWNARRAEVGGTPTPTTTTTTSPSTTTTTSPSTTTTTSPSTTTTTSPSTTTTTSSPSTTTTTSSPSTTTTTTTDGKPRGDGGGPKPR